MLTRATLASTAFLASLLPTSPAAAQTFPADADWLPLQRTGSVLVDAAGDTTVAAPARDLVGSAGAPVAQVFADATYLYFRLQVDGNPRLGGVFASFGWGCQISGDGQASNYELMVLVDGGTPAVQVWRKSPPGTAPADLAGTLLASYNSGTTPSFAALVRTRATAADFFLDFAVPRSALGLALGTPVQFVCGANADGNPRLLTGNSGDIAGLGNVTPTWAQAASDAVSLGCLSFPCADGICDGTTCVECLDHPDCFDPARLYCFNGSCVECLSSSDCPDDPAPICDPDTHTCSSDVLFADGFEPAFRLATGMAARCRPSLPRSRP